MFFEDIMFFAELLRRSTFFDVGDIQSGLIFSQFELKQMADKIFLEQVCIPDSNVHGYTTPELGAMLLSMVGKCRNKPSNYRQL